jgi:hypothetical protein
MGTSLSYTREKSLYFPAEIQLHLDLIVLDVSGKSSNALHSKFPQELYPLNLVVIT